MSQTHRGVRPSGPFGSEDDRRVQELDDGLRIAEVGSKAVPLFGLMRDPHRVAQVFKQSLDSPAHFTTGLVIHALPYHHWYKVQCGGGNGFVAACAGTSGSVSPIGTRSVDMLRPNDHVLLYQPAGLNYAIIFAVLPPIIQDGAVVCPDWIVQGGGSGLKREPAHKYPIKYMYQQGGVIDWSANRPIDGTSSERGWISATGLAMLLDNYLVQVRVNEQCGLFLCYHDSYARLCGVQLDVESAIHGEYARDDEGESRLLRSVCTYPWEALGLYAPGSRYTQEYDDQSVQYGVHRGKMDLAEGFEDVQPVCRYVEYGGYLGQGGMRAVVRPAKEDGIRRYQDTDPDEGLFRETISLDGDYSLLSAKGVHIGKRCKIVVPKELRPPEDGQGDDATTENYKFSSMFGKGPEHKVGDVTVEGERVSLRKIAAFQDVISHLNNWKALHPFHYHEKDFLTPQESEQDATFDRVQDILDFDELKDSPYLSDPIPKKLKIDHRYGDVEYFQREAFFRLTDDGSVHIGCGYGAEIVLSGGKIRLACPAGIELLPGTDLVILAEQIMARAKRSVDISATENDVRIKAERNMQFLAGNAKEGGMLFECLGEGNTHEYRQKYGEDVKGAGIVFRTKKSTVAVLSQDIYFRTGGADLGEGDILFDAGQGHRKCQVYAGAFHTYTTDAVTFAFGPVEDRSNVDGVCSFSKSQAIFGGSLLVKDAIINFGDRANIVSRGGVKCLKGISCDGRISDKKGGMIGKVPDGHETIVEQICETSRNRADELNEDAEQRHKETVVEKFYGENGLGRDANIEMIRFSFRDPPGQDTQYKVKNFRWPETRWQMMARLGMASGGQPWREKPVVYQGRQTYPYPGLENWKEEPIFDALKELTLFEGESGYSKDRPAPGTESPYETPQLSDWESSTMEDGYTLAR